MTQTEWTVFVCDSCGAIQQADDGEPPLKCDGEQGERHRLKPMRRIVVIEKPA